jgi:N-acetylneuraminic acid mutarotase
MNPRFPLLASLALTLFLAACAAPTARQDAATTQPAAVLAPMPEAVTSFGAVTESGWLYVFGGHKGERHDYSADQVSGLFHRLNLSEGKTWEPLPGAAPSQGLPLIAYHGSIHRIGGMAARNPAGTKQDLFSTAHFERFDPKRGQWEKLSPLPAPRSSHDAVVMGDKLYVAGGWQLAGGTNKPVWPANALVLDLKNPATGWREFLQPFQRRALALAAQGSRLYCIGGMNSDNQTTLAVDIYDTTTGQWSKGPDLPPGKHKGFSCSAIAQNGRIYANMFQGDLLRLALDGSAWEIVGRVKHPRLSHRIVTAGATQLIALGGEDGEAKRPDLELLTPSATPRVATQAAAGTAVAAQ